MTDTDLQRRSAEETYAEEIAALCREEGPRPENWRMTPKAVLTYVLGGRAGDGTEITAKYVGRRSLVETAVASLATGRGLLLLGSPGTAKSWLSEHLAAAISGDSGRVIQCTAGTAENAIRYSWNYALLLKDGPSEKAVVPTPLYRAMQSGSICRIEELTRSASEVQDTLLTVMSDKILPVPELDMAIRARRGFGIVATANDRDRGVNQMSSALQRRFNTVVLPLPDTEAEEVAIVSRRVSEQVSGLSLAMPANAAEEIVRVVRIFRELRSGRAAGEDRPQKVHKVSGTLSPAEAIDSMVSGISQAAWFSDGRLEASHLAPSLVGAMVKDPQNDGAAVRAYCEGVLMRDRKMRDHGEAILASVDRVA